MQRRTRRSLPLVTDVNYTYVLILYYTIPTGYLYSDSYQGSVWPLYIDDDVPIKLNIGDALLYTQDPKKHVHWRLPFEGIYQVQLLLHYVTGSNTKTPRPHSKINARCLGSL